MSHTVTPPPALLELYRGQRFLVRALVRARWLVCPFTEFSKLVPSEGEIADVGCGIGLFANWLAIESPARRVTGLDANPARIAVAQKTVGKRCNITFRHLSATQWEEADRYDAVALVDLLHHARPATHAQILRRAFRAVKPGGLLLLKEIGEEPRWRVWATFLHDLLQGHPPFLQRMATLEGLMQKTGFQLKRSIPQPYLYTPHVTLLATK